MLAFDNHSYRDLPVRSLPVTASTPSRHRLDQLRRGDTAIVTVVEATSGQDAIAIRLEDLGFVPGELLRVISRGPIGGDPLVVQVGFTRFALRRAEAARVYVVDAIAPEQP